MRADNGVELRVMPDHETMSRLAADMIAAAATASPAANIAVPTGNTPLGMFADLVGRVERGELDLSRLHVWCLDEYVGVAPEAPSSLTGLLASVFLRPARIDPARVHALPATDPDVVAAAARYETALAAGGGLDLAVLGVAANGHVAYNEPGATADSRTRVVDLTPASIAGAAAYFGEGVPIPRRALTVGIGTLLEARYLVLIVSGEAKAETLRRILREPMTADVPASWLRLAGDRLAIIADEAAAGRLG